MNLWLLKCITKVLVGKLSIVMSNIVLAKPYTDLCQHCQDCGDKISKIGNR